MARMICSNLSPRPHPLGKGPLTFSMCGLILPLILLAYIIPDSAPQGPFPLLVGGVKD